MSHECAPTNIVVAEASDESTVTLPSPWKHSSRLSTWEPNIRYQTVSKFIEMNIKQNQTSTLQNNAMAEKVDGRIIEPGPKAEGDTNPNPSQCLAMYFDKAKKVCDLSSTILLVTFPSIGFSSFFVFRVVLLCRCVQISTPKATDGWKSVATSGSNSWRV